MLTRPLFAILAFLAFGAGAVAGQSPGAPIQLVPQQSSPAKMGTARATVPSNWKIVDYGRDPVTRRPVRAAITMPKPGSAKNLKSGSVALTIQCFSADPNYPTSPEVILVFTSLSGVGRYKKYPARYRFDNGTIYSPVLTADIGTNGARKFFLPILSHPIPTTEIAGAHEFVAEVDLHRAGIAFLDFNVTGADAAMNALDCK